MPLSKRTRHHSPTSGLSWSETIHTTPSVSLSARLHDILHKPIGVPPELRSVGIGVDALETMAMRCLSGNLGGLEDGSLEGVSEVWLDRIWRSIEKSNLQSLHLWQLFTKRGTSESPVTRTHKTTTCHHIPISLLATSISCSPTSYLTSLTLVSSITDTTSSLHCLSTLPNLVSLNINGSSSSANQTSMINDDTIRLWNKKARLDKTVFSYLKSLFLRFQPGVTEKALAELSHFPKLEMVVTSRCGVNIPNAKSIIKDRGWKMSKKAFYAHAESILESSPKQGKNYLDIVESYITASVAGTPLSFIQIGRQSPTLSTNVLFDVEGVECWVRDTETKGEDKRKQTRDHEETKPEDGKKRRKIKDAKKGDFMGLLGGM